MATLTNKEMMVLKDEIAQEELCIVKYEKASKEANDPELKELFSSILEHEKEHLKTLNRALNGDIPDLQQENQQKQSNNSQETSNNQNNAQSTNLPTRDSKNTFNGIQLNLFQNEINVKIATEFGNDFTPEETMKNDFTLCEDALTSEKYVSSTYNSSIFDCINKDLRKVLNHIQKEEQEHGEQITAYMLSHSFLK